MSSYKYNDIVKKAKECVNNIVNKQKNGIDSNWSYYLSKAILTKKDVKKIDIAKAAHPVANPFNKNLKKDDYIQSCKNYVAFVEKKNALPNYVTVCGVQISPHLFTGLTSFILAKNIPKELKFNSNIYKDTKELHPYMTNQGCAGMGQCTAYNCGCNSLQQCFYRLTGIKVDESQIAKWAGTTTSGTDHQGLETAVAMFNKKYKKNVKITWKNFSDLGNNDTARWKKLAEHIKNGAVFCHILYRDKWGHYEVPKTIGDDLSILNSLGDKCTSTAYCGYIETRAKSTQKRYIQGISQKSIAVLTI